MRRKKRNPGKPNTSVRVALFNAFEDENVICPASLMTRLENYVADFLKQKSSVAIMKADMLEPKALKLVVAFVRSLGIEYKEG
jgi:hypothetical protein